MLLELDVQVLEWETKNMLPYGALEHKDTIQGVLLLVSQLVGQSNAKPQVTLQDVAS